ncbi:hypothetical protein CW304_02920 [Bacillus sp. UFRGS-B20]|nr:hypothetical protein CW304_02920 [Bacillus sp. UFRGS-B20]
MGFLLFHFHNLLVITMTSKRSFSFLKTYNTAKLNQFFRCKNKKNTFSHNFLHISRSCSNLQLLTVALGFASLRFINSVSYGFLPSLF